MSLESPPSMHRHLLKPADRLINSGGCKSLLRNTYKRSIHASNLTHQAAGKRNKDLFTPSPFKRSNKINIDDKFAVQRDLREGDNTYGVRRYLLLSRNDNDNDDSTQKPPTIIASINANKNILFGAQLHVKQSGDYIADYFAACEPLLDIAKEDASINGQQVQALAALNGLSSWVTECLERDGEGSQVLTSLLHGEQSNILLDSDKDEQVKSQGSTASSSNRRARQNVKRQSAKIILENESDRILMVDAIRAIATGVPRPGHSVVGQGTYRDGEQGWKSLAWEYSNLATVPFSTSSDGGVLGLEEVSLYKSRDGEVAKIEHLASVEAEYLKVAGGAMARMFFV